MFEKQIARIVEKLNRARRADRSLAVFGASKHKYQIGPVLTEREIEAIEQRFKISLPSDFKAFLMHVGHGGTGWWRRTGAGAGPYYGLVPIEKALSEYPFPHGPLRISPNMTDEHWEALSGEDVDEIYAGLAVIGQQGCTYAYAIALNGEHRGRVVNIDEGGGKPFFAYEANFLDWYERWLDEVIAGGLREAGEWFGFTMGGDDVKLLEVYRSAQDDGTRCAALEGLAKLETIQPDSRLYLREICEQEQGNPYREAVRMLTKFDAEAAIPHLTSMIDGDEADCRSACESIHWYATGRASVWQDQLLRRLPTIKSERAFSFAIYVLQDAKADRDAISEFVDSLARCLSHDNVDIRVTAMWALATVPNKGNYIDVYMTGLRDLSPRVVRTTLQSLNGFDDRRLLAAYYEICSRFNTDDEYVLTNLDHRLKELGFRNRAQFVKSHQAEVARLKA